MEKKLLKGVRHIKQNKKDFAEAISRLKQASMNTRVPRKGKLEGLSTDKILSANAVGKHIRYASQVNTSQMRNLSRVLSPSRSNSRTGSMKRKNSLSKGLKYSKSKITKLQRSYILPYNDPKESSIKSKRFSSTNKIVEKDKFPILENKIKPKGLHSYLNSSGNFENIVDKLNNRKSKMLHKSTDHPTTMNVSPNAFCRM